MRRREFIQCMLPLAGMPLIFPMWSTKNLFGAPPKLRKFSGIPDDGRVLVIVQLAGGNDGLNTVIPYQHDNYYNNRPVLGITQDRVLDLNGELGFHPRFSEMHDLYQNGKLAVVQGVGYDNPNRSHFKSTDIWMTASDSDDLKSTGWLGRYFDQVCPPADDGRSTCETIGPPAIQIGLTSSLALLGKNPKGISLQDPISFYNLVTRGDTHGGNPILEPKTAAERELFFLRDTAVSAFEYAGDILEAYEQSKNTVSYPGESLAAQLAVVSRLISGGLSTRVFIVSIKGFDTHASQEGVHDTLLSNVSRAISTFQKDIENLGLADRVLGMCFSEFGRRVEENGSGGTDHGTAAPMFLFGRPAMGGLHGPHPGLNPDELEFGDLRHQFDFRQVYATVLSQWLGAPDVDQILGSGFEPLPLVDPTTDISENDPALLTDFFLAQNYPNPFNPTTTVQYSLPETLEIELSVFNMLGRKVKTLFKGRQTPGVHRVIWDANGNASGTYFLRLRGRGVELARAMQLLR